MIDLGANYRVLRRLYEESLPIDLIAEPLESVNADSPAAEVAERMDRQNWDTIGVRKDDSPIVHRYVLRRALGDGVCGSYAIEFEVGELVSSRTPIDRALRPLAERKRLFVLGVGGVESIVTLADLHKQPVSLMLFAAVSVLEMAMLARIRNRYPDKSWKDNLSEDRLCMAEKLYQEREKHGQEIDLSDCLQFCDKANILKKELSEFWSRKEQKRFRKDVERLRNNLAHAQTVAQDDGWMDVADLLEKIRNVTEHLLGGDDDS